MIAMPPAELQLFFTIMIFRRMVVVVVDQTNA